MCRQPDRQTRRKSDTNWCNFYTAIHRYEDSNTVKSSFTRLVASVSKRNAHRKAIDRSGCCENTILKRMFGLQQINNMRTQKHNKRNINKYYFLGLQNKGLSRVGCVTGKVEIQMDKISLENPEENKTNGTHVQISKVILN